MITAESTDLELVAQYLEGDSSAFDQLFKRYHSRIRAVCLRAVGDEATADDMLQETFLSVIRAANRIDEDYNFGAWIHRIAANVCTDELRRRQRRLKRDFRAGGDSDAEEMILRLPDHDRTGDPEAALEIQRLRRLLWEVAKKLPERQRMVLTLRELQGKSYTSIGRLMGISESAVETLLHRARMRFRQEFLMLEGPREDEGTCAVVDRLLSAVGWNELQAPQRKLVEEHLEGCSWCREHVVVNSK